MRIFFTGGSGKAGRHVAPYLAEQGHQVTNADLVALGHPSVADLRVDLTDAGETYSALAGLASFAELDLPSKPGYDAVVHFAAIPRILLRPDAATYATNVISTFNVLEAATRLGVRKVVFASSETTYGICFAQGERRPLYVPVDEDHPTVPEDAYAMSKVAGEATARSFQARTGTDVYGLRINNVIEPHEYEELFPAFLADPSLRRRNVFAYIDVRDLGQLVLRCLQTDGLGYEVFNVANADMSVAATSSEIRQRFYDGVEVRREMGRDETFYAIDKARRLLGFDPRHSWRDVLPDPGAVANAESSRHWAETASGWVENERIFDAVFAPATRAILGAADLAPGQRVLDVGCGTGTLLAACAAAGAAPVGVDIAPGMVAAAAARVPAATVLLGDAQVMDLTAAAPGPPFDRVVSRFGVMFFDDPEAAFANIRRVASGAARLAFACWRSFDENPMFTFGTSVLADRLDPRPGPPGPNEPGPTAFADRERLARLLTRAGWTSVDIAPLDITLDYGFDGDDGVEQRLATLLSTTTGRAARDALQPTLTAEAWAGLLDDVRTELRLRLVDGAVRMPAALWLVTARNPDRS